ncbi:MAG TPA: hypothetical protein VGD17_20245 [Chitinophagaceae bacterium]
MLKRIAIVAFFTGTGQLFSIFVLKYLSQHSSTSQIQAIAEIDSLVLFILNIIGQGLQYSAMRNIAQSTEWKKEFYDTQSARFTLSLFLILAAGFAVINQYYLVFLISPVLAWSGDYALYGRGYPIQGSIIAFIRLMVPYSALLLSVIYFPGNGGLAYVISLLIVYLATNFYISYFLGTDYFYKVSFRKLRLYITSAGLGVATIALYFLGLGLVLIAPYLYPPIVVTVAFIGLKFYVIYKGVLRIITQAFLKEMQSDAVCLKVDQLSIIAGTLMFGSLMIFPDSFINFFFGKNYLPDREFFMILGVNALIYSVFLSFATTALFKKADRKFALITVIAVIATVISMVLLSYSTGNATGFGISLLIGELVYATGLIILVGTSKTVIERLSFLAIILPPLIIPMAFRYWLKDDLMTYIISFSLLSLTILIMHYRKFKTLTTS